jgi:xanthine dehydrogenase YagT iron-sulfur-binding subunit
MIGNRLPDPNRPATGAASSRSVADVADIGDVRLCVNGELRTLRLDPRTTLLDALREHLGLTGSKKGCDHGQCGACTVHIKGRRALACLLLAVAHQRDQITTIEGLGERLAGSEQLHWMQIAFIECDAFQCGYCTPGQIMSAVSLIEEAAAGVPVT